MNCRLCGTPLRPGSAYCHVCGQPIRESSSVSEESAQASLARTVRLRQLGRVNEELAAYDEIVDRFVVSSPAAAAEALLRKAARLTQLGKRDEAKAIYIKIHEEFGKRADTTIEPIVEQAYELLDYLQLDDKQLNAVKKDMVWIAKHPYLNFMRGGALALGGAGFITISIFVGMALLSVEEVVLSALRTPFALLGFLLALLTDLWLFKMWHRLMKKSALTKQ